MSPSDLLRERMHRAQFHVYRAAKRTAPSYGQPPWRQSVHYRKGLLAGALVFGGPEKKP